MKSEDKEKLIINGERDFISFPNETSNKEKSRRKNNRNDDKNKNKMNNSNKEIEKKDDSDNIDNKK